MSGLPPEPEDRAATAAVERLLLVTLTLEEALRNEQFPESSALLTERDSILAELRRLSLSAKNRTAVERIQQVERRIVGFLSDWRTLAMNEFESGRRGKTATTSYLKSAVGFANSMDGRH